MIAKICGIKTIETLRCCENNKVNFFGMIFYNKSPRNITFEEAFSLQKEARNSNQLNVALGCINSMAKIAQITT